MNTPTSSKQVWTGRIISGLMVLFMLMDGIMKLFKPAAVLEANARLGYPESTLVGIGVALLAATALYIVPRTSILGAILITGYLGGAVASDVRAAQGLFNTLFPVVFGILVWVGLWLRDSRLRRLVPLSKD
ncbi:MAG TPA: DoxX family protein [Bryobacteraceae bacterium]|jgi:hypothetical protein